MLGESPVFLSLSSSFIRSYWMRDLVVSVGSGSLLVTLKRRDDTIRKETRYMMWSTNLNIWRSVVLVMWNYKFPNFKPNPDTLL